VYRADLGLDDILALACQHPGNVWSLHGYRACLIRLGKREWLTSSSIMPTAAGVRVVTVTQLLLAVNRGRPFRAA
jgi:hypothetical protein